MSEKRSKTTASANNNNDKRRPYSSPSLKVLGSVGVLTQAGAGTKVEGKTGSGSKARRG